MAWKKIIEEQANVDLPIFTAYQSPESVKIVIQTIHPNKKFTMYFDYEEIEDFFFFMEQVYEDTSTPG